MSALPKPTPERLVRAPRDLARREIAPRREVAKRVTPPVRESAEAISTGVIESVEERWDPAIFGPLDAPWVPTHYARPERKFVYLVTLIDAHLKAANPRWGISLDDPHRATTLTIRRRRFLDPLVLPVRFAERRLVSVGSREMSLAERGVAQRLLRHIAERIGAALGVK